MKSKGAKQRKKGDTALKFQSHLYNYCLHLHGMGWVRFDVLNGRGDYPECVEN